MSDKKVEHIFLRNVLSVLFLTGSLNDASNGLMRDVIIIRNLAERFFILKNAASNRRPIDLCNPETRFCGTGMPWCRRYQNGKGPSILERLKDLL